MKAKDLNLDPTKTMCDVCLHDMICKAEQRGEPYRDVDMCIMFEPKRPHGEWIWKAYDPDYDCGDIVCSKCSVVVYEGVQQVRLKCVKWNYCPDCGADMREKK